MMSASFSIAKVFTVFSYKYLIHALAGGIGNAVAITVFFPLETARTRLQVQQGKNKRYSFEVIHSIWREEGLNGLYRGWFSLMFTLFLSSFTYFYVFHCLKAMLSAEGVEQYVVADLVFGLVAGFASVFFTNPFWVINTRLKLQHVKFKEDDNQKTKYSGIYDCLQKILYEEGWQSLWSGVKFSLILCCNPAINSTVYETLKRSVQVFLQRDFLGDFWYFMFGAIAKMTATILTYPLQIVQTRLRAGFGKGAAYGDKSYASVFGIIRGESVSGLFRGLEAKLSQTVLTSALMFMVYEEIMYCIFSVFGISR